MESWNYFISDGKYFWRWTQEGVETDDGPLDRYNRIISAMNTTSLLTVS